MNESLQKNKKQNKTKTLSLNSEAGPPQTLNLLVPWSHASQCPELGENKFLLLISRPVYGILLQQPRRRPTCVCVTENKQQIRGRRVGSLAYNPERPARGPLRSTVQVPPHLAKPILGFLLPRATWAVETVSDKGDQQQKIGNLLQRPKASDLCCLLRDRSPSDTTGLSLEAGVSVRRSDFLLVEHLGQGKQTAGYVFRASWGN